MPGLAHCIGIAAAVAALVVGGCSDGGGGASPPPGMPAPPPDTPAPPSNVPVLLSMERVFPALTFASPVAMLQAPNDASRWFVVEQGGVVRAFTNDPNVATAAVFVDISERVILRGELGLLGMAFHPQFGTNRRVYLFYSFFDSTLGIVSRLSEFTAQSDGLSIPPSSERVLMTIPKPNGEENHNGGNLAFGPDGLLYAAPGDGGGADDQHGTIGNAQSTNTVLGKMLRIDVTGASGTYAIPSSNPFAVSNFPLCSMDNPQGRTQPCPEIFAIGFRNPFRWSFDRDTGQLWVGDVGQNTIEEVDRVEIGGNYGWRCFEGARDTGLACGTPGTMQPPVAQYGRSVGVTVIGGYVYRGSRFPGLVGRYIFGDFDAGRIFNIDARAQPTVEITTGLSTGLNISSFGEDVDGELYFLDYFGSLFRIKQ